MKKHKSLALNVKRTKHWYEREIADFDQAFWRYPGTILVLNIGLPVCFTTIFVFADRFTEFNSALTVASFVLVVIWLWIAVWTMHELDENPWYVLIFELVTVVFCLRAVWKLFKHVVFG